MSFTWFADKPMLTREQIAREVHQASRARGLDELATVIALMTISTEVGTGSGDTRTWWCPANLASPVHDSINHPHDSISNDNRSMGYFQQQPGPNGEPWWGSIADMMALKTAANTFLSRLSPDYRNAHDAYHAGIYAQKVQGSAFPDRYARAWDEAWDVLHRALNDQVKEITVPAAPTFDYGITKVIHGYNPTTCAACTGNSNGPRAQTLYAVVHTQEGNGTAVSLTNYCNSHKVSYNLIVDDTDTVECVPVDQGPWAAVAANDIAVHICFAGSFAAWSRDEWLARDAMLHRGARAVAAACQQYDLPPVKVLSANGWPVTPKGIAGHVDFGRRGGGHHDPGNGFPWPEFIDMVKSYMPNASTPTDETGALMALTDAEQHELLDRVRYISDQLGPNLWGPESSMGINADGEELTLRDGLAAHIRKADK